MKKKEAKEAALSCQLLSFLKFIVREAAKDLCLEFLPKGILCIMMINHITVTTGGFGTNWTIALSRRTTVLSTFQQAFKQIFLVSILTKY